MSYTTINGMRSTRFPLQGNCRPCQPGFGGPEETASLAAGATSGGLLLLFGVGALVLWGASSRRTT